MSILNFFRRKPKPTHALPPLESHVQDAFLDVEHFLLIHADERMTANIIKQWSTPEPLDAREVLSTERLDVETLKVAYTPDPLYHLYTFRQLTYRLRQLFVDKGRQPMLCLALRNDAKELHGDLKQQVVGMVVIKHDPAPDSNALTLDQFLDFDRDWPKGSIQYTAPSTATLTS